MREEEITADRLIRAQSIGPRGHEAIARAYSAYSQAPVARRPCQLRQENGDRPQKTRVCPRFPADPPRAARSLWQSAVIQSA